MVEELGVSCLGIYLFCMGWGKGRVLLQRVSVR